MTSDPYQLQRSDDGVATLTLDRPERRNALTFEAYRGLCEFFRSEQLETSTRVVIITGAGKGFCSGGDVHDIIGALRGAGVRKTLEFAWMTGELVSNMRAFDRPIIAAVNGTCAGAGAVIALAADFRVLAEDTSLHLLFTKVGLTGADMGVAWLLQRLVGAARATELLMLGDPLPAAQALSWGLANRLAPAEQVLDAARELAARLVAGPALALRVTKRLLNREATMDLGSAIEAEALAQTLMMLGEDHDEFHRAFLEQRPPRFGGA